MTYSCCHFLQNQFTKGLTKYFISTFVQHSNYDLKCSHLGKMRHLFLTVSWGCGVCRCSARWIKRRNFSLRQSEARGYLSRQVHFSQLFLIKQKNTSFYCDCNLSSLHFYHHFTIFALICHEKAVQMRTRSVTTTEDMYGKNNNNNNRKYLLKTGTGCILKSSTEGLTYWQATPPGDEMQTLE